MVASFSGRPDLVQVLVADFSSHPDIVKAINEIADGYFLRQEYQKANQIYQYGLDTWPRSADVIWSRVGVATSNLALGDDQKAQATLDKLLDGFSGHPEIPKALNEIAENCHTFNKTEKAEQLYQYVLANWPGTDYAMESQGGLARLSVTAGDEAAADAAIEKLLAEFSGREDIAGIVNDIGHHYFMLQKYERAGQLYQYVIDNWPDSEVVIHAQAGLARFYIAVGDDPNAQTAIDTLIVDFNDHPDLPDAISNIEEGYYVRILSASPPVREDYLRAVWFWKKVTEKFPDFFHDPDLYYFIADCYRHLGEYEKAIEYYGIVAANWTQNGYAVLSNAVVPRAEDDDTAGDYEALHETIDRLIADFGDHPGLACLVTRSGHGYRRRANDARREGLSTEAEVDNFKAIGLYGRVINEFGSSGFVASSYFFSALCYRDLGQWQDALDCCNHLLDNWPEYKYATWREDWHRNVLRD